MNYYAWMRACRRIPLLGVPKSVLMVLATYCNKDGRCWPSIDTLVADSGWGRTAVIKAIHTLEAEGVLIADRSNGRSTAYWIKLDGYAANQAPLLSDDPDADAWPDDAHPSAATRAAGEGRPTPPDAQNQCATRTGSPRAPVRHATATSPPGALYLPRTIHKYQKTPLPPEGGACAADACADPGFAAFIAAYPRPSAIERARRQWARMRPSAELQANMLAALALQRQSAEWQREGGRFVPLPSKWLHGKRWQDCTTAQVQRATRSPDWMDDPAQVKEVGAGIGLPYSLAALGNGYTDDERIAHYRRYRASIIDAAAKVS